MEETKELIEEAVEEQKQDATNTTYAEDDGQEEVVEPAETNEPEYFEQTEGDVVPVEEPKEEWQEDANQNQQEIESDIPEEVGTGAFSKARNAWANGWGA